MPGKIGRRHMRLQQHAVAQEIYSSGLAEFICFRGIVNHFDVCRFDSYLMCHFLVYPHLRLFRLCFTVTASGVLDGI